MKRCKHKNGYLIEYWDATHTRDVISGKLDEMGDNDEGHIIGYEYHCNDCKKTWRFRYSAIIRYKWLKEIYNQLR